MFGYFVCSLEAELLTADFVLSHDRPYPETMPQQDPTQGADAELLSWQVVPSSERIAGDHFTTMASRQCGFDVWGLGGAGAR